MQRPRRAAVVYATLTGLLAAVAITAGATAAAANTAGFCSASGAQASCTQTHAITGPASVGLSVTVTQGSNQSASVAWTANCSLAGQTAQTSSSSTGTTPLTANVTLPFTDPDSCTISATATLTGTGSMLLTMSYTPAASSSPSPSPTPPPAGHVVKGYAGKCLDDAKNSSARGAKAQIWTCNAADKAQLWTYSNGELVHNGLCLNDQAWGGKGTKVILWTCNHALNELWTHLSNGEYVLNAKGYRLCLDDPAYSTRNGTQLIVYTCKDSTNQRWQQP